MEEASSAAIDRLNTMDLDLLNMGYSKSKTGAVILLEWFTRDLITRWKREVLETGHESTMSEWALRQMTTTDCTRYDEFETLEMQIRGLGRLAGLSYAEATMNVQRAWSGSLEGAPGQKSPDGASPGRVTSSAAGTSATKPTQAEAAAEFLAPNK